MSQFKLAAVKVPKIKNFDLKKRKDIDDIEVEVEAEDLEQFEAFTKQKNKGQLNLFNEAS
jgi:hypothetical protein